MSSVRGIYVLLFFCITSCRYDVEAPVCDTPSVVSFSQDIIPLLNKNCNLPDCHSGSSPEGNLNLEPALAYDELLDSGSGYIDTLNPDYSIVLSMMKSVSDPMPPAGNLDECTIGLMEAWIRQKAKEN